MGRMRRTKSPRRFTNSERGACLAAARRLAKRERARVTVWALGENPGPSSPWIAGLTDTRCGEPDGIAIMTFDANGVITQGSTEQ